MEKKQAPLEIEDIEKRFGLVIKSHRIGSMDIRVAEVERVDEMVRETYPDAVTAHGDSPSWMVTWPSAFGLAEYILHNQPLRGKYILELGCGTAATGVALARAGAFVVCTDYDPLARALARYNARLNGCSSLALCHCDWYRPHLQGSYDLVVGSEITYFKKSFSPLLSVLKRLTAPDGKIILSDQYRPQMELFLKLCAAERFSCRQLKQVVYLPDGHQPVCITVIERIP